MRTIIIRDAEPGDFESICSLNHAEVKHTSPMDLSRLIILDSLSCYHKVGCVDGRIAAFLLAMNDRAAYENDNFAWFAGKHPSFVYVDRIVVSAALEQKNNAL